jgi:hypothetical protein
MEAVKTPAGNLRVLKSVAETLNGALSYGQPTGDKDSTGVFSKFTLDNVNNIIIRIGANGSTNGQYQWSSGGVAIINHGLQRQPIGFRVLDKDATCDVYRTGGAPTVNIIQLTCTDAAANVTVEIF